MLRFYLAKWKLAAYWYLPKCGGLLQKMQISRSL
jgi:hypothetical protein